MLYFIFIPLPNITFITQSRTLQCIAKREKNNMKCSFWINSNGRERQYRRKENYVDIYKYIYTAKISLLSSPLLSCLFRHSIMDAAVPKLHGILCFVLFVCCIFSKYILHSRFTDVNLNNFICVLWNLFEFMGGFFNRGYGLRKKNE